MLHVAARILKIAAMAVLKIAMMGPQDIVDINGSVRPCMQAAGVTIVDNL